MWDRSLTPGSGARISSKKARRALIPRLDWLEDRQLLSSSGLLQFDFGTSGSPVLPGAAKVTPTSRYSPEKGFGWNHGTIRGVDRKTKGIPQRAFNSTANGVFAVDLQNATYLVRLTSGDARGFHDKEGVYLQGVRVDTIATAAGRYVTRTYTVTVTTGQLDLGLVKQKRARDPVCVINELQIEQVSPLVHVDPSASALMGQAVTLPGTVQGGPLPYTTHWDFGDGSSSDISATASHVYMDPGVYHATLTVTNSLGYSSIGSTSVIVGDIAPTATVSGPGQGYAMIPISVQASATSISPAEQAAGFTYVWSFGDGTTSAGPSQVQSHTYTSLPVVTPYRSRPLTRTARPAPPL